MNKKQADKRFAFQNQIRFLDEIISLGNGIILYENSDMINTNEDINIKNDEIKIFLE